MGMTRTDTTRLKEMEAVMAMAMSRKSWPASSCMNTTGKENGDGGQGLVEASTAPHTSRAPS